MKGRKLVEFPSYASSPLFSLDSMTVEELLQKYAAGERNFPDIDLSEVSLIRVNLKQANLTRAVLIVANLSGANLSDTDLSEAKLNVARLSGANLSRANMNRATINVTNLILANLSEAQLVEAEIIRSELIRADLSRANLTGANLNGSDFREARFPGANLSGANLGEVDLRGASLVGAIAQQVTLNGANLSRSDLSSADLTDAEMRHANLNRANLSGANLSRANLRWADLRGANLQWADLSHAKLSGANLMGADLRNANLVNASLVHADLTQTNLIEVDWEGADISGAILTGSKLHGVARFGLKTEGISCEWVDLSPHGINSEVYRFTPQQARKFFNQKSPWVQLIIDKALDREANYALAAIYYYIGRQFPELERPPSINIGQRKTTLTFRLENDGQLFVAAYMAILPFEDAAPVQKNITELLSIIQHGDVEILPAPELKKLNKLCRNVVQKIRVARDFTVATPGLEGVTEIGVPRGHLGFLVAPSRITLSNSGDRSLDIYHNPMFGRRTIQPSGNVDAVGARTDKDRPSMPTQEAIVDFVQGLYYLDPES